MPDPQPKPKVLLDAPLIGQSGSLFAGFLITRMGSLWTPTNPQLEVGVDGVIELRDPRTRVVLGKWLSAQVKTTVGGLDNETPRSFTYTFSARDIAYWRGSSNPVIVIVVRPDDFLAWWRHIDSSFDEVAGSVEVEFDKDGDRLSTESFAALLQVAGTSAVVAPLSAPAPTADAQLTASLDDGSIAAPFLAVFAGGDLVPAVDIVIVGPNGRRMGLRALIDSGASETLFPASIAEPLGFDLSTATEVLAQTGGGTTAIYRWHEPIAAQVARVPFELMPCFGSTPIALLGRSDFFTAFEVAVDAARQTVTLRPHG